MDGPRFRKLDPVPFSGLSQENAAFPKREARILFLATKSEICIKDRRNFRSSHRWRSEALRQILGRGQNVKTDACESSDREEGDVRNSERQNKKKHSTLFSSFCVCQRKHITKAVTTTQKEVLFSD